MQREDRAGKACGQLEDAKVGLWIVLELELALRTARQLVEQRVLAHAVDSHCFGAQVGAELIDVRGLRDAALVRRGDCTAAIAQTIELLYELRVNFVGLFPVVLLAIAQPPDQIFLPALAIGNDGVHLEFERAVRLRNEADESAGALSSPLASGSIPKERVAHLGISQHEPF